MEVKFREIDGNSRGYYLTLAVLGAVALAGVWATFTLIAEGLWRSGMTNRIPWGMQIVMAVFYIGLSAGSLVVSGLYGIFGRLEYKPFARVAAFLAMLFLIAGLLSIVTDQGRLDRVIHEPFQHGNPLSMFSINPALYCGHIMICIIYLWALFKEKYLLTKFTSVLVVLWAICVHTGTGAIFAFVPRELYNSPLLPPSFVAAALSSGAAFMILLLTSLFKLTGRRLDKELIIWLARLLAVFIILALYMLLIENAHRYYLIGSREAANYYLFGPVNGVLFWVGLIVMGSIVPAVLLFKRTTGTKIPWIIFCSILVVLGVICERYLIVLPGLTHPPDLFPGWEITQSVLDEGVVTYRISLLEIMQALGVLGVIGFMFTLGLKLFKLLPTEARALASRQPD